MSSHHRTGSESSFEFVKSEGEAEVFLKEDKKENEDVLSLKDEVSSKSDTSFSDSEEDDTNDQEKESETAQVFEHLVGDSMGLTVEIPETPKITEKSSTESSEKIMAEEAEKAVIDSATNTLQSDPLGATESPILESVASLKEDNEKLVKAQSTLLTEVVVLRAELEKIKEVQAKHARMIQSEQLKRLDKDEAERRKEQKRYSPITTAICGEWRLVNLEGPNESMKFDGFSFPDRFKSLVAHTVYDYDEENKLQSHQRLFCKTFGHSTLRRGEERLNDGDLIVKTYLSGNMLVTVWDNTRRSSVERKERYVMDGQLYISHVNDLGERNTMVYERVKSKMDCISSFGKASRFYLKFW